MSTHLDNEPESDAWLLFGILLFVVVVAGILWLFTLTAHGRPISASMISDTGLVFPPDPVDPNQPKPGVLYVTRTNNTYWLSWWAQALEFYRIEWSTSPSGPWMEIYTGSLSNSSTTPQVGSFFIPSTNNFTNGFPAMWWDMNNLPAGAVMTFPHIMDQSVPKYFWRLRTQKL